VVAVAPVLVEVEVTTGVVEAVVEEPEVSEAMVLSVLVAPMELLALVATQIYKGQQKVMHWAVMVPPTLMASVRVEMLNTAVEQERTTVASGVHLSLVQAQVAVEEMAVLLMLLLATQAVYGVHIPQEAAVPLEALMVGLEPHAVMVVEMVAAAEMGATVMWLLMVVLVVQEVFLAVAVVLVEHVIMTPQQQEQAE